MLDACPDELLLSTIMPLAPALSHSAFAQGAWRFFNRPDGGPGHLAQDLPARTKIAANTHRGILPFHYKISAFRFCQRSAKHDHDTRGQSQEQRSLDPIVSPQGSPIASQCCRNSICHGGDPPDLSFTVKSRNDRMSCGCEARQW